ncbi:hypothetical protein OG871_03975 [Kitasatospora sp. NBC_00374]|uniref:hypothetical protein n=1 Tax=Kitasatospora sp. NBC_00374 TaxID=2975964 RepID=UPI0032462A3B
MGSIIALLGGLAAVAAAATLHLIRRDRHRYSGDLTGLLIEQQHTARAVQLRRSCSSAAVHHGTGLVTDVVHPY